MKEYLYETVEIDHYEIDSKGYPIFLCHTEDGKPFNVKPKGTVSQKLSIAENIDDYLGNYYEIKYEELSEDDVPLKAIGIGLEGHDIESQKEGK